MWLPLLFTYCSGVYDRQMLLTQAVKTGITLYASIIVDRCSMNDRIDVDCSHRTNVSAVSTSHTFGRVDFHLAPALHSIVVIYHRLRTQMKRLLPTVLT